MIDAELLAKAYKKLKSSVYFDKTQLILREKIVNFESEIKKMDKYFDEFAKEINNKGRFKKLVNEIIESISVISFPKKLEEDLSNANIIMNDGSKKLEIGELQHFIDMDVRGHILGILWIMLIGYRIDKMIYKHSYGNRIRKSLYNELSQKPTYSPYLFQPYFEQYESWRDTAMEEAVKHLKLKQDVIIMTMDFKRYYYSVDINKEAFNKIYDEAFHDDEKRKNNINMKLNKFVYSVIKKYSELFDTKMYDGRKILPIGFLPSNVIGNWYLNRFDKAIIDGWNPIYYGRYVDDILIVDKVEHNSEIYKKAKKNELTSDSIIEYFLIRCSKWHGLDDKFNCKEDKENSLLIDLKKKAKKIKQKIYKVNPKYNATSNNKSKILVQNDKVRIFYFKSSETDALITCFRKNIAKNKSEFRHMPEDEAVFKDDDYSEIYHLKTDESLNKFRGIEGISIDKYELSKFIGKHLRVGGLIEDVVESRFEKDIYSIFNQRVTIENYILWEKVIEIFVINERFETAKKFIFKIMESIEAIDYNGEDKTNSIKSIKKSLYVHLYSSVNRAFALVWKKECTDTLKDIYYKFSENNICNSSKFNIERRKYCNTRMIDKYVMPIPIDMIETEKVYSKKTNINLTHFYDVLEITRSEFKNNYIFYPYLMTMYDFSMISAIEQFNYTMKSSSPMPFEKIKTMCNKQNKNYLSCNYNTKNISIENSVCVNSIESTRKNIYEVSVGNAKKDKLSVAIANVKLDHINFEKLIKGKPNRSHNRYRDLSIIVNEAIDKKADMLIMPESFVPFEWLPTLARTCTKNNLAIVTGVEHIRFKNKIFNLTAVLLPYREEKYQCVHISFHLKTHYAPIEKREIHGYRLHEVEGKNYELYKWNGCYFPVYCCYELASINDRALFQSYADFLIAIEWNKDTNYYSNILESLSRDIHCYCIQVNSSDYGDSRITKPSKTEEKDMIRTKGGRNSTILVDTIDISKLRNFQIKEYELQKQDKQFKTTSPDFNVEIVMKKIRGENLTTKNKKDKFSSSKENL